jgi:hypothetical protein
VSANVVGKTEISTSVEVKATIMVQIDLEHPDEPAGMARALIEDQLAPLHGDLSDWGGRWAIVTDVHI